MITAIFSLLQALFLRSTAADSVLFSVSAQQQAGSFHGLDEAFRQTAGLGDVELNLLPTLQSFSVSAPVFLSQRLWVQGQGQSILLGETLYVTEIGQLTFSNVSLLLSDSIRTTRILDIRGTLVVDNCSVSGFQVPLLWLYGSARLSQMHISNNSDITVLIRSGKADLNLTSVISSRLSASLVALSPEEPVATPFNITVTDSEFEDNIGLPIFTLYDMPGSVHIVSSSFARNSDLGVDVRGSGFNLTIANCTFRDNNSTIIKLWGAQAEVSIRNCTFTHNWGVTVYAWAFSGQLMIEESTITKQKGAGLFYMLKAASRAPCLTAVRNSYFADINTVAETIDRYRLIFTSSCALQISNVTISNVTLLADPSLGSNALILSEIADVRLSNVSIIDSGTSGCIADFQYGTISFLDVRVENFYSGASFYFFAAGSTISIRNMQITKGTAPSAVNILCMIFLTSNIQAWNVSLSDSIEPMGMSFTFALSNYSISYVTFARISMSTAFSVSSSSGNISNVIFDRIQGDMHTFQIADSVAAIANVTAINSQLDPSSGFIAIGQSPITLVNFSISNFSGNAIIGCGRGTIATILNLTIQNAFISKAICYTVNSQSSFQGFTLRNSLVNLITVTHSNLTIEDSSFTALYFEDFFLEARSSNISFLNLNGSDISTVTDIGRVTQGSRVSIERCTFEGVQVKQELGWQISDSAVYMLNSRFSRFNFGLFQATGANITLQNSTFTEGRNPVQSLRSATAFGGVLSCVDCPFITIQDVKFFNISARVGGAVAAKRSSVHSQLLKLVVNRTEFVSCKALQAGALFVQNVTFTVDRSEFVSNTAEQTGGGIFAAIKPRQSGLISNSRFAKNSAAEGGAVKWSNAPVVLINLTFEENSAAYGPDTASYGVVLSSALTSLAGNESSGYPATVVFELQDHYGHRVTLSPFKTLLLLTTPTVAYRGNSASPLYLGLFTFPDLTVYSPPATTQVIQAALNDSQEDFSLNLIGEITIRFRSCKSGEIQRLDRCDYCYPGYFSFSPSDANCSFCPANAFCPGGNAIQANPGNWRNDWNSSVILPCLFPAKCVGGQNSTCVPGFTGILCNQCAPNSFRLRAAECMQCQLGLLVVQLCAPVLVLLSLRWVIVHHINKVFVVKVIITHCQYLSALCFLRVSYSQAISWSLHAVNWLSALLIPDLPLACLGVSSPEYAKALIGSLLLPSLLLLSFLMYFLGTTQNRQFTYGVLVSSLLYYSPYITLISTIPLLACQEVDSAHQLLFLDMRVTCWQDTHHKYVRTLVLPSLLLNILAPITIVLIFRIFRPTVFTRYFLLWTAGYERKLYDLFLSALCCFFLCNLILTTSLSPLLQVAYAFSILIFISTANVSLYQWTYYSYRHFLVAEASLLTVALSLGFLSYYVLYLPGNSASEVFSNVMVLLLNAAFLGLCGWSLGSKWLEIAKEDKRRIHPLSEDG